MWREDDDKHRREIYEYIPNDTRSEQEPRTTLPSFTASFLISSICPSNSGRQAMNSSPLETFFSGSGMRDWTGNASTPVISRPTSRARMTSLRATSMPLRSSRGSGSLVRVDLSALLRVALA